MYIIIIEDEVFNCEAYLPSCTVGGGQAEHKLRRVDGRGRYGNEGRQ